MKRLLHSLRYLLIAFVLGAVTAYIPVDYYLVKPGVAEDLKEIIHVENGDVDQEGGFLLTAITTQQATVLTYLLALADPRVDLMPKEEMLPEGMSMKEYLETMERWMEESQLTAEVVALRKTGHTPKVTGQVTIEEVMADSPARGKLQKGDIIKAVDGEQVLLSDELVKKIQNRRVGETVKLEVQRGQNNFATTIKTTELPEEPGKPVIKVMVTTRNLKYDLPIKIDINTREIKGPSAGLMFTLEIINQLQEQNLTKGQLIAGTGTIDINENVGEIGGVKQKVMAAEKAGAKYFLAPVGNVKEARQGAERIKVIPVRNLDDALRFLQSLKAA